MKDTAAKSGATGWGDSGWDDDSWGDPFADVEPSKPPPVATAKTQTAEESRRLRQEERRKKQEAARQKRAAGIGSRPKLGARSDWLMFHAHASVYVFQIVILFGMLRSIL